MYSLYHLGWIIFLEHKQWLDFECVRSMRLDSNSDLFFEFSNRTIIKLPLFDLHISSFLSLCICADLWLYRSSVLCWAWHHDHQIGGRVFVFIWGFWLPRSLPLLLDHCYGAEALVPRHHHSELCRICLHSFLPRLHSPCRCYKESCSSSYM